MYTMSQLSVRSPRSQPREKTFAEQQLTLEDVPLAVDWAVRHVAKHGLQLEGIYRIEGNSTRVALLVDLMLSCARCLLPIEPYTLLVYRCIYEYMYLHSFSAAGSHFTRRLGDCSSCSDQLEYVCFYSYLLQHLDFLIDVGGVRRSPTRALTRVTCAHRAEK